VIAEPDRREPETVAAKECAKVEEEALEAKAAANVPGHFTVVLERTPELSRIGVALDLTDLTHLQVVDVFEGGLIATHNKTAPCEQVISVGMYILSVNGTVVDGQKMEKRLLADQRVELSVASNIEFKVAITREAGQSWALDVFSMQTSRCLLVKSIGAGPVKAHNDRETDEAKMLKPQDRIVKVNGVTGCAAQLLEAMKTETDVWMVIARPALAC